MKYEVDERDDRRNTSDEGTRTDGTLSDSQRSPETGGSSLVGTDAGSERHETVDSEESTRTGALTSETTDDHDRGDHEDEGERHDGEPRREGRGGASWWLIAGIVGALVLVFLFYPRQTPYLSPAPTPPKVAPQPMVPNPLKATDGVKVVGFYDGTTGQTQMTTNVLDMIKANKSKLDYLAPRLYDLKSDGTLTMKTDATAQKQLTDAGVKILPRINVSGGESAITDAKTRAKAVQSITDAVTKVSGAGCILDLPKLPDKARAELPKFLSELRAKLPGKMISVTVPPVQSLTQTKPTGTSELKAISDQVDQLVLMMTDGHSQSTASGPVAPISWVETNIKAVLAAGVPANKLILGVATWGFDWVKGKTDQTTSMPMNRIPAAKTDSHSYDTKDQASYLTYTDSSGNKHEMWWEDEKTLGPKVDLAKRYSLGGLAVLKLNYSDQAYWTALGKYLGR